METPETQELAGKEVRGGRPPKTVATTVNLPVADHETLAKAGIKREEGYLYFIDKQGDISRAKMARRGKKK